MPEKLNFWGRFKIDLKVGNFLAKRDLKRASIGTTGLIVFVMLLTFLNLVVVSGILVGLIQGSIDANKKYGTGDIVITPILSKSYIENTQDIIKTIQTVPEIKNYIVRYTTGGTAISNYRATLLKGEKENSVGASISGIDPQAEDTATGLSHTMKDGSYLDSNDSDGVMIGKTLLYKYTPLEIPGFSTLKNIDVGSKVLVKVGDNSKEYVVKGILGAKVDDIDNQIFMISSEFRKMTGRTDLNANKIAIFLKPGTDPLLVRQKISDSGLGDGVRVQTFEEGQPKFLKDMTATFAILGNAISSIGLVVAAITIFIVIFVNAITRRRYIGILKGIGISPRAIAISYVLQSVFYAIAGSLLGFLTVFLFLKPYFANNPIDFPFSNGILVATVSGTFIRAGILFVATTIAGYLPARIVIKQNTLSAILGR